MHLMSTRWIAPTFALLRDCHDPLLMKNYGETVVGIPNAISADFDIGEAVPGACGEVHLSEHHTLFYLNGA